ncbi:MAG TPA: molecular chaperone DjiA, partial [Nannocystis exedens]|nr:molecular chaperone DjiA [Nannocystis exedens]
NSIPEDAERFAEAKRSAVMMREQMSETQRASVLLNLIEIARADGEISAAEDAFIAEITQIFNLTETRAT